MIRRAIALGLSCAAVSGCSGIGAPSFSLPNFNMPSGGVPGPPGTLVRVTSLPAGAEASFGGDGQSCTTPCTLSAPNGTGTYNVSFKLNGYQPQSVPVRISVNESGTMRSGDAGIGPATVITPDPVTAELEPFAPAVMKAPAARTKAKPATKTATTSSLPAPPVPPPPISPPATTQPNVPR